MAVMWPNKLIKIRHLANPCLAAANEVVHLSPTYRPKARSNTDQKHAPTQTRVRRYRRAGGGRVARRLPLASLPTRKPP
jgi:hypothetical protein